MIDPLALPWLAQSSATEGQQFHELRRFLAESPTEQQERHVDSGLGLAERRDAEWHLKQLFEVRPRVVLTGVASVVRRHVDLGKVLEVIADRDLDHAFVGADDEGRLVPQHEQPDGLSIAV